jgi:hypothetical protein
MPMPDLAQLHAAIVALCVNDRNTGDSEEFYVRRFNAGMTAEFWDVEAVTVRAGRRVSVGGAELARFMLNDSESWSDKYAAIALITYERHEALKPQEQP